MIVYHLKNVMKKNLNLGGSIKSYVQQFNVALVNLEKLTREEGATRRQSRTRRVYQKYHA